MGKKAKPGAKARTGPATPGVAKSAGAIAKGAKPGGPASAAAPPRSNMPQWKRARVEKKKRATGAKGAGAGGGDAEAASNVRRVHVGLFGRPAPADGGDAASDSLVFRNKTKVLILSTRGILYRYRHLLSDVASLLPHSKRDPKVDVAKGRRLNAALLELMDLRGCGMCLFFEMRKRKDLYLWMTRAGGPSVKFLVSAVHTMEELKLTGNHLKGSRPLLTFSPSFAHTPVLRLLKEVLSQIFATPKGHRKSKPFYDHVITFTFLDNHIWFRNYQICIPGAEGASKIEMHTMDKMSLVEVGPRFCLNPIRVFSGSFGGPTLYENPLYVSPNKVRAKMKRTKAEEYKHKVEVRQHREKYLKEHAIPTEELAHVWDGKEDEEDEEDVENEEGEE